MRARRKFGLLVFSDTSCGLSRRLCKDVCGAFGSRLSYLCLQGVCQSSIRRYFSACATLVITFALFRDSVQQFTFFTIKASVVNFTIAYLTALTFLFFVYVAIYIADADVVRYFVNARRNVKCDSRFVKGYALHNDGISASASYLRISPVCLQ